MANNNNGYGDKGIFVEKNIIRKRYEPEDKTKARCFEIARSNFNLIILGKRWNEKYNNFSLAASTRFSAGWEDSTAFLLTILENAIHELSAHKVTPDDFGKEIFKDGMVSSKGASFHIVAKVGTAGDVKVFFVVESGEVKDIIPIENVSGVEMDNDTPYYLVALRKTYDKVRAYVNDTEANDKLVHRLMEERKRAADGGTNTKEPVQSDDEFPFDV